VTPATLQDLAPRFAAELGSWDRYEATVELEELLQGSFKKTKGAAANWRLPSAAQSVDLETARAQGLREEFERYVDGGDELRVFRRSAVRLGFNEAWERGDYATILSVAEKLPGAAVQEDPELLRWVTNAATKEDEAQ
jgi:hypothetical protein